MINNFTIMIIKLLQQKMILYIYDILFLGSDVIKKFSSIYNESKEEEIYKLLLI